MTKTEQIRITTWRSKVLQHAATIGLLEKTAGLLPTLQQALEPLKDRIDCAFVYGSVARREEHARSDVDLLVIGAVGQAELAPAIRKAEGRLGREVNVSS